MPIEKQPFVNYSLDDSKKQDIISLKLNPEERTQLEKDKVTLQQEKDGTAIKDMMAIARKVIHDTPEGLFFQRALENIRKNKRIGIVEVEPKNQQK